MTKSAISGDISLRERGGSRTFRKLQPLSILVVDGRAVQFDALLFAHDDKQVLITQKQAVQEVGSQSC